jgi:hypothetical protein
VLSAVLAPIAGLPPRALADEYVGATGEIGLGLGAGSMSWSTALDAPSRRSRSRSRVRLPSALLRAFPGFTCGLLRLHFSVLTVHLCILQPPRLEKENQK